MNGHSLDITRLLFRLGLLRISPSIQEPFENGKLIWHKKSAYLNPGMYTRVVLLLKEIIKGQNLQFDYIVGAPTGGIPWASLLSHELSTPSCIQQDGIFYTFPSFFSLNLNQVQDCDYVAANILGIPMAIYAIRDIEKPLLYIKPQENKKNSFTLEGSWMHGKSVCLYEAYTQDMKYRTSQYEKLLKNSGLQVIFGSGRSQLKAVSLERKKVLIIDDIYNSGNSQQKILTGLNKAGAHVSDILTLFNQQTNVGKNRAQDNTIHVHSIVNSTKIIQVAATEGLIPFDEQEAYISAFSEQTFVV